MGTTRKTQLAIIGSTGSIGRSALDVVREHGDTFEVAALAAGSNLAGLTQQIDEFAPRYAGMHDGAAALALEKTCSGMEVRSGSEGINSLAALEDVDIVILSVVGMAGLGPALAAVRSGKRLALATKEVLVSAGPVILEETKKNHAEIIPVDSEHSAILQCLQAAGDKGNGSVDRLILTASGGPFRTAERDRLRTVTPEEALAHPTWSMGSKITIDSATLMNKGLEVIEARWLFDMAEENITVVIHPQSIVHSLVEFCDGSMIAQLSQPDMRLAILYALSYPERRPLDLPRLDLARIRELTFYKPDMDTFPCLKLAYEALRLGGTAPAILNAANEVAVGKFLKGKMGFMDIPAYIENALETHEILPCPSLDDIIAADILVREAG